MDPRYLPYAEQQAPRYTSYPTAPHFSSDVNSDTLSAWLAALTQDVKLSLYVHVPYCRELCWYCGCNTFAARRAEPVSEFTENILREVELAGDVIAARDVQELHWGGGTPNILSPAQFTRIHHQLAFWFDIASNARHSIEIDPRCLSDEHLAAYRAAGVTRASIGAQDFNPHVQQAMGRIQPAELVSAAIEKLRAVGIAEISMDLMYGLPHQSIGDLTRSVRTAAALRPQRIALFGYAHVPWFKKRQRLIDEKALPTSAYRFAQAEAARDELVALGYVAVGLDHFALPTDELALAAHSDQLHRSFQGYGAGDPLPIIGFGPSAISTLPEGYAQNHAEVGAWTRAIGDDRLPVARGHAIDETDRRRAAVIEQIMCAFDADLTSLGGAASLVEELSILRPLMDDELVFVTGDRLVISPRGRPFCRLVAQAFDAYAQASPARHSNAV